MVICGLNCLLTVDILFLLIFQANNHGSLQIICEYYRLCCPTRGSTLQFHPLEHLHPLEYHRPEKTVIHVAGSTIDLRSCNTSLEYAEVDCGFTLLQVYFHVGFGPTYSFVIWYIFALFIAHSWVCWSFALCYCWFCQAHSALLAEEEASALSIWAIACICGSLRLEYVSLFSIFILCINLCSTLLIYVSFS